MRVAREQAFRGLAGDDRVGDCIGMLLVDIASRPDSALELDARPLLYDVCRLVRYRVQRRR
jgi:hypothetical protein